jgi:hypothetical protein
MRGKSKYLRAKHKEPDADEYGGPSDNDADDRARGTPRPSGKAKIRSKYARKK